MSATEKKPRFSLIIPVKDQRALTRDCLLSLMAYTPALRGESEVLMVDDGSGAETRSFLNALPHPFRVIRNEENLGFAQSNNRAAREARGEFLLLLNNDLVLQRGWLEPMVTALESSVVDRIVGNVQLSRGTARVDHAGKFFDADGHPRHFGQFFPELFPWQPRVDFLHFPTVTAACWALRRSTFLGLGGFDPEYRNGFEDDDLCMRAQQEGVEVGVALGSRVYHHVSASEGRKVHEDANAQLFLSRWQSTAQHWHETQFADLLATLRSWAPSH